ncbi:SCO family protein [Tumebacillus sp. DT12]|uniref:SCO family protein n=1 Tax=Tumebacillus lacus TaxID=2995335 RepID=A0ABT3X7Q9_9BACL|nr:SCO family protein [Tumebacillus lacus]MCX7570784.1 SCO family protein [Tumebacillus lacus]
MKHPLFRYTAGILGALTLAAALAACSPQQQNAHGSHEHASSGDQQSGASDDLSVIAQIEPFTLENINSQQVSLDDELKGKARLVYFMYTNCPDACPITTGRMASMMQQLKNKGVNMDDVKFLSITVDPERDTADVMKKFAESYSADTKHWEFLRGNAEQTQKVMDQFGVSADEIMLEHSTHGGKDFAHNDRLFLLDANNNLRQSYLMGPDMEDATILKGIETLLAEKK